MDVLYSYRGLTFIWNGHKAVENFRKHGVRFETAAEVFLDPLSADEDASVHEELRLAIIGRTLQDELRTWCMFNGKANGSASSRHVKRKRVKGCSMKTAAERVRERLGKERVMTAISLRMPEKVIEDLKEIAPMLGFAGYQSLIKAYVSHGLRKDMEKLEGSGLAALTESLRKRGIADVDISAAIKESGLKRA